MSDIAWVCVAIIICSLIFAACWYKSAVVKTEELRRKYPLRTDNVPYSEKNIWKK
jgi:hypothetical protein